MRQMVRTSDGPRILKVIFRNMAIWGSKTDCQPWSVDISG